MYLISKDEVDDGYNVIGMYDVRESSTLPTYFGKYDYLSIHNQKITIISLLKENSTKPIEDVTITPKYPTLTASLVIIYGLIHKAYEIQIIKSYIYN